MADYLRWKKNKQNNFKKQALSLQGHIKNIKNYSQTKRISYPDYKEAYDYVNNLFPHAKVLDVIAYMCPNKYLESLGYHGVGGFYNTLEGAVVLPQDFSNLSISEESNDTIKISGKIEPDEALVHELLHYVSDTLARRFKSIEMEEEFAYGYSVGYLKSKGYSDEQIIEWNFLPYLIQIVDHRKIILEIINKKGYDQSSFCSLSSSKQQDVFKQIQPDVFHRVKQEAFKLGKNLLHAKVTTQVDHDIYKKNGSRFDMIDFE